MFDTSAEDAVAEWYRDRRRFWISKNLRTFIGPVYRWLVDKKREGIIGKIRDAFVFRFDDLRLEAPTLKFEDWHREFPDPESYRPRWKRGEATWYQVYETVSEGTPVTPPFETREELVEYLVERGDFWDQKRREDKSTDPADCEPWSREAASRFVFRTQFSPTMMVTSSEGGWTIHGPSKMFEDDVAPSHE